MVHVSRLGTLTLIVSGMLSAAPLVYAGGADLHPANPGELLLSNPSQGYLGVGLNDVDNDRASALKLKEARGAEIMRIDQDAPAAKANLKVHDVVVQMNGQRVESVEQLRRMLRETPPGRSVSLVVMRDGQAVTVPVQLADRAAIAKQSMVGLGEDGSSPSAGAAGPDYPQLLVLPRGHSNGFLEPFGHNREYVGLELQPLTSGLAEYFGVHNGSGVLVGTVFPNTPAAVAGLKAADVIQKVNGQPIVSLTDWERAIRLNHGKPVQVTVIRDKKEQTLSMVAGEAKKSSELQAPDMEPPDTQTVAELQRDLAQQMVESMKGFNAEEFRQQAEEAARSIDMKEIQKAAEQAAQSIDTKEIEKAVEQSQQQFQENRQQIEQQMQNLKQALQSLQLEQMD